MKQKGDHLTAYCPSVAPWPQVDLLVVSCLQVSLQYLKNRTILCGATSFNFTNSMHVRILKLYQVFCQLTNTGILLRRVSYYWENIVSVDVQSLTGPERSSRTLRAASENSSTDQPTKIFFKLMRTDLIL